jgi:hypothetical protein
VTAVAKPKQPSSQQAKWEVLKNVNAPVKIKPLKRLTTKLDKPVVKLTKPKEKQYNKSKNSPAGGLSITAVPSGNGGGKKSQQPKLSMSDLLNVSKDNASLIITPVENKNQPTLQQKLAAKQLANTTRNASGTAVTGSKSSGGSGYAFLASSAAARVFPVPVVDASALRFDRREAQVTVAPTTTFHHSRYLPNVAAVKTKAAKKTDAMELSRLKALSQAATTVAGVPSSTVVTKTKAAKKVDLSNVVGLPSSTVVTKTKAAKKSETIDLMRLKALSKSLVVEASSTKSETLKSSFKALESNRDLVIIPPHKPAKLPKSSSELEIITLKDKK